MAPPTEKAAEPSRGDRRSRTHFYGSRLARRVLLLFVLSALVPLLLFAGISIHQVTKQLEEQSRDRLRETCKAVGMTMVERLHLLRADLLLVHDDLLEATLTSESALGERMKSRFDWIALSQLDGVLLKGTDAGIRLPSLTAAERDHLIASASVLLFRESPETGLSNTLLAVVANSGRGGDLIVFGQIRPDYMWGGEWLQQPYMEFVTLTEDGEELLFATDADSELRAHVRRAMASNPTSGRFDWDAGSASHLASYRTMFTRPRFHHSFVVAVSEPRDYVLEPIATFKALFLQFGMLTLCIVVGASLFQIRRSLSPIQLLRDGTRRLASNFAVQEVVIRSGDEFEDLAESFNEMAHTIRHRTAELERANQIKSDFLARMSHELRTPLSAVLGYAQLSLADDCLEAERQQNLEIIRDNGEHLTEIVDTILDMSVVVGGGSAVDIAPCRPAEIVARAIRSLAASAGEKGLDLIVEHDPAVPETIGTDATRLGQTLINVVDNAIKFTERGEVHVRTSWESSDEQHGHRLAIRVRDTGYGIAADSIDEIFEPFHQIDLSMSRRHGGTGLGLSIARAHARALGGDVTCRSKLGAGSEFTITIEPGEVEAVPAPAGTIGTPEVTPPSSPAPPPGARELRILIAEDIDVSRKLAAAMIERAGHAVEVAENGLTAHDKVLSAAESGQPFDAVLMDMQMPVMDGYEATRRLRAANYPGPIIALTAHALDGDRERCLDAGCDDYATKPFDSEELLGVIQRNVTRLLRKRFRQTPDA